MNEQMSILECKARAQDEGYETATFDIVGAGGCLKAKWLDAYMGLFQIEGEKGFRMTSEAEIQFSRLGLRCENFQAEGEE